MILVCPSCATRYFADDESIPPQGRQLRCAACAHSWFFQPELVLQSGETTARVGETRGEAPPAPNELTRERVERARKALAAAQPHANYRAAQAERRRRQQIAAALGGWGASALIFGLAIGGAIVFRGDITRAWPQTASAYAAVGLPVNTFGLSFADIEAERRFEGETPILRVTGLVKNDQDKAHPIAPIRLLLRGENGELLREAPVTPASPIAPPKSAVSFAIELIDPPLSAFDFAIRFAHAGPAAAAAPTTDLAPEDLNAAPLVPDSGSADATLPPAVVEAATSEPADFGNGPAPNP